MKIHSFSENLNTIFQWKNLLNFAKIVSIFLSLLCQNELQDNRSLNQAKIENSFQRKINFILMRWGTRGKKTKLLSLCFVNGWQMNLGDKKGNGQLLRKLLTKIDLLTGDYLITNPIVLDSQNTGEKSLKC